MTTAPVEIVGVHPYAAQFPMLHDDELAALAESIGLNGLRSAVVVTPDGLVLDGRNRLAACDLAGVKPDVVVYAGTDFAEYVIDANVARRNMSTGARAMTVAQILVLDGRRKAGRWVGWRRTLEAAPKSAGWQRAIQSAGVVLDFAPDLAGGVVHGDVTLDAALRVAETNRDAEREKLAAAERLAIEEAEAQVFITDTDPDLAAQVGKRGLFQTYVEARDVWARRNREEADRLRIAQYEIDQARLATESDRRSAIRNLDSVLMHLTGTGIPPATFADRYYSDILIELQYTPAKFQYAIDVLTVLKETKETHDHKK